MAGWWLGHPSEKYEVVNWDDEQPNIFGKIKNGNQTTNQSSIFMGFSPLNHPAIEVPPFQEPPFESRQGNRLHRTSTASSVRPIHLVESLQKLGTNGWFNGISWEKKGDLVGNLFL